MKALVLGASGQLGQALVGVLGDRLALGATRADADVVDRAAVARLVDALKPDVVFNATAYNNVDGAESEPALALAVNGAGPRHIAAAAARHEALVVHISTNYVFDGSKATPYTEEDVPAPRTAYGVSKLAGELMVAGERAPHLIVRTSAVFGDGGSRDKPLSFVRRMVDRARCGETLAIVDDQTISTTHAGDLAASLVELVERGARGLFHVTNAGSCTWHELATEALRIAGVAAEIRRVRTEELGAPARRPLHSAMESVRLAASGIKPLRPWRAALQEYLTR